MGFNYWQRFDHGLSYHIYNRTVSETDLFRDNLDYNHFLKKYDEYFSNYFLTSAYCLIPNHFHLLVEVKSKEECEKHIIHEKTKAAYTSARSSTIDLSRWINNFGGLSDFKEIHTEFKVRLAEQLNCD